MVTSTLPILLGYPPSCLLKKNEQHFPSKIAMRTESCLHARSQTTHTTHNGTDPSETTNIQQTRPTGGAKCAGMLCVRECGGRAHATCTCAPTGAAMLLPCAAAMPRRKRITSSGSGSGEDGSSGRQQKKDLEVLLADQLDEDDAVGPRPAEPLQSAS